MKILLHRFPLLVLLSCLLALPATNCHAQWKTPEQDTSTEIVAPPVLDEEYQDEEAEDTGTIITDIVPYIRPVPADSIAAYKKNASFAYLAYLDSLLRAEQKAREAQPSEETVEESPSIWDARIVKLLCYLVAIGLVGFVVYKLFIGKGFFFRNRKTASPLQEVELGEDANESDLEKALRTAIGKGDYRLGIRYLFLMTLQRLGEKGTLQLSSEKTNYQYATELAGKPYATRFAQLSLQYEYVWFGNFTPNEQQFSAIRQQYQQFLKDV